MATQPTNIIDPRQLEDLRRDLEGDHSVRVPDFVGEAVGQARERVEQVFVAVPQLSTFIIGYLFGAGTLALAILLLNAAHLK